MRCDPGLRVPPHAPRAHGAARGLPDWGQAAGPGPEGPQSLMVLSYSARLAPSLALASSRAAWEAAWAAVMFSLADVPDSSLAMPATWLRTVSPKKATTVIAAIAIRATMMMYSVMPWPRWRVPKRRRLMFIGCLS